MWGAGFAIFCSLFPIPCSLVYAQAPALTTVKDTVYKTDGSLASGSVVITWPSFLTADSKPVFGGTKTVTLTSGALSVALVPNAGGTPSGTSYNVKYFQSGGIWAEETWQVPSSSPLADPAIPVSVTQIGTAGTTTYFYWCTATNANGETLLSPARSTATSNATLSVTNYNQVVCATVTSATGYKLYRTVTSTAPSGTGNYLVGSAAVTTINDQSNTLTSVTVPSLNTTDPKTLAVVRVTAAPTPSVIINATQVSGTAVVQSPAATQTITAPASSGIPLQVKGKNGNASNVLEVYDNAGTPALQTYVSAAGTLNTARQIVSSIITGTAPLSVASTTKVTNLNADTLDGIDSAAFGLVASPLSQFAATTSAQLAGVLSDETGSGLAVFGTSPTIVTPTIASFLNATHNHQTAAGGGSLDAAAVGSGNLALARLPVGTANQLLGANAGATAVEQKSLAVGTAGTDFAVAHAANSITFNLPDASATARGAVTTGTQTFEGAKTFNSTVTTNGQTIVANAYRFYTGGADGSTAYTDFRTNPVTGNGIISAKTGALYSNFDHGNGGHLFCDGAGNCHTTISAAGALAIGDGAAITHHYSATASLDFASVSANACSTLTITVTGAADGDTVALGIPNALASIAGLTFQGFVSALNTIAVKACNVTTSASADPAAATVRADVWQH